MFLYQRPKMGLFVLLKKKKNYSSTEPGTEPEEPDGYSDSYSTLSISAVHCAVINFTVGTNELQYYQEFL